MVYKEDNMSRVIAVANQKGGGVGKTTTAVNLSASLAYLGQEVLLVDIDPQGNATSGLGVERNEIKSCIYDVLINEIPIERAIVDTKFDRLKAVPASIQLAGAEVELVLSISREIKLKEALRAVENKHSIIIIDCPPPGVTDPECFNRCGQRDYPIQCEYYALEGWGAADEYH